MAFAVPDKKYIHKHKPTRKTNPERKGPHDYEDFMRENISSRWSLEHTTKRLESTCWYIHFSEYQFFGFSEWENYKSLLPIALVSFNGMSDEMNIACSLDPEGNTFMLFEDSSMRILAFSETLEGILEKLHTYDFMIEFWICFSREEREEFLRKAEASDFRYERYSWNGKSIVTTIDEYKIKKPESFQKYLA